MLSASQTSVILSINAPKCRVSNLTYDGNGNVTDYVDANGTSVAHYEYGPFGGITASSGAKQDDFTHRFSTKPFEQETGIVHYELRPYIAAELGRWLSRDPVESDSNPVTFIRNSPFCFVDLLGLELLGETQRDPQKELDKLHVNLLTRVSYARSPDDQKYYTSGPKEKQEDNKWGYYFEVVYAVDEGTTPRNQLIRAWVLAKVHVQAEYNRKGVAEATKEDFKYSEWFVIGHGVGLESGRDSHSHGIKYKPIMNTIQIDIRPGRVVRKKVQVGWEPDKADPDYDNVCEGWVKVTIDYGHADGDITKVGDSRFGIGDPARGTGSSHSIASPGNMVGNALPGLAFEGGLSKTWSYEYEFSKADPTCCKSATKVDRVKEWTGLSTPVRRLN